MWSWIEVETMIIIPDDGLHTQWEWTQMTLMRYGSNKLKNQKKTSIQLELEFLYAIIYEENCKR